MNDDFDNAKDDKRILEILTKPELGPRPGWPKVMMAFAEAAALRSRDATTRVGAVICTSEWRVVGTGYNGPPAKSPDDLTMSGPGRHAFVIHAEENAILQAIATLGRHRLVGCQLFSTHRPCGACILRTSHAGINEITYSVDELSDDQRQTAETIARILRVDVSGIE